MDSTIITRDFDFGNSIQQLSFNTCEGKDQVSHWLQQGGWRAYESPLPLLIAKSTCKNNATFFDIGANTGYYSIIAAMAGAEEVRAFEPIPFIMEALIKNIEVNPNIAKKISTFQIALSDNAATKTIYMPHDGHGLIETSASLNKDFRNTHSDSFPVKCMTLDETVSANKNQSIDRLILKIDVESHEPEALKGSVKTIKKYRPLIFLEILPDSDINFFYEWAYRNHYNHCIIAPPNQVTPTREIIGSLKLRDHLFFPEETDLNYWF